MGTDIEDFVDRRLNTLTICSLKNTSIYQSIIGTMINISINYKY